jgi:hypothetical protein
MSIEKTDHSETPDSKVNWLPLVLGAVIVLGLIIFIFKGCKGSNDSDTMASRADAVVASLKASGAQAAQFVGTDGNGSQYATIAANASDEERKKDRRIAISVRAK